MSRLHDFPGGLRLPGMRELSNGHDAIDAGIPGQLYLPLQQHIGLPARPLVAPGDSVSRGQAIAIADGYVSVSLHAPTSGRIRALQRHPVVRPGGGHELCIVLEADGEDRLFPDLRGHEPDTPEGLLQALGEAGLVGMGGAGFPAHVKLREARNQRVDTLIINAVECEPYITCDDRLLREQATTVVAGALLLQRALRADQCLLALEEDMPQAWEALRQVDLGGISLRRVPAIYPVGGERQLIRMLTGRTIPRGGLPASVGVLVHNVATAAAAQVAISTGMPLIERYVTVTGEVSRPGNYRVRLGTPVSWLLRRAGGGGAGRVIMGGAMMGLPIPDQATPVIKTSNCILVLANAGRPHQADPCIHCGECVSVCPAELQPQALHRYAGTGDYDAIQDFHLFDCIECGCCDYVCPSHIPLTAGFRAAKREVNALDRRRRAAAAARRRYRRRQQRLARLRQEAGRPSTSREAGMNSGATTEPGADRKEVLQQRQAFVQAAIRRSRERRAGLPAQEESDDGED